MATLKNTTITDSQGILNLANGGSLERSASPQQGMTRFNTDRSELEIYNNAEWQTYQKVVSKDNLSSKIVGYNGGPESFIGTGSQWLDYIGNTDGNLRNNPSFFSDYEGYYNFNGSNESIDNNSFNIGSDPVFSISMWIRRTGTLGGGGYWGIGGAGSSNGINCYTPSDQPNKIAWDLWGTTTFNINADYPLNEWIHVCWVKTSTGFTIDNLKIFVNGAECPLTVVDRNGGSSVNLNSGLSLGRISVNSGRYHGPGDITNVVIFDRALTAEEASLHYISQAQQFNSSTVGSSPITPAESAEHIRQNHSNPPNGFYWIRQTGNTAYRHFCVFKDKNGSDIQGGPWTAAFVDNDDPGNFSNNGKTSMNIFRTKCRSIGVDTPGRGMEDFRTASEVRGAWLAAKIAIWEGYTSFVDNKSSDSGGVIAMPIMNINGEGGSSDHRTIYEPQFGTILPANENADRCDANQLFCGWWGSTDVSSWTTNNNQIPGPEDWGPANPPNSSFGNAQLDPMLIGCIYK